MPRCPKQECLAAHDPHTHTNGGPAAVMEGQALLVALPMNGAIVFGA